MSVLGEKIKGFYKDVMASEWSPFIGGIIIALFAILHEAWSRPWGIVGGLRNWGEWFWYWVGLIPKDLAPSSPFWWSSSIMDFGFLLGAFISATLANEFGLRFPPIVEIIKAIVAGILMGLGAALARGCNIGAWYEGIGNLSASGFIMMAGLIIGVYLAVKYIIWEVEHIPSGGGFEVSFKKINWLFGIVALIFLFVWSWKYFNSTHERGAEYGGLLLITAALGYAMHRSRFCIVRAFREPFLSGEARMTKAVALSLALLTTGVAILKLAELQDPMAYVVPTFGLGAFIGGIIFGFGMVIAGGCGSGSLWRVAEGQIKLLIVVIFFGLSNAFFRYYMDFVWDIWDKGILGKAVYLPDHLGYAGTLIITFIVLFIWYIIIDWNEDTNKFVAL